MRRLKSGKYQCKCTFFNKWTVRNISTNIEFYKPGKETEFSKNSITTQTSSGHNWLAFKDDLIGFFVFQSRAQWITGIE